MTNVHDASSFHVNRILNECSVSPTVISNLQSSSVSISTSSSSNKSCPKVVIQTKDVLATKRQQEQIQPKDGTKKHSKRGRGRPSIRSKIMAFDSKSYTVKELKRAAKKSRVICDGMEQREQKRLEELAYRLFYSSSDEE